MITMGALYAKFYHHNHWDTLPSPPITSDLKITKSLAQFEEDGWWIIYYGGFHVLIEKHYQSVMGPHIAKLRYKSQQTKRIFWIATLQVECFYFSEEEILTYMFTAIRKRWFYLNPDDTEKQIPV